VRLSLNDPYDRLKTKIFTSRVEEELALLSVQSSNVFEQLKGLEKAEKVKEDEPVCLDSSPSDNTIKLYHTIADKIKSS
jgi:hypothetical protein